jgi:hypothetical protein
MDALKQRIEGEIAFAHNRELAVEHERALRKAR